MIVDLNPKKNQKRNYWVVGGAIIAIVVIGVGIGVGIAIGTSSPNATNMNSNSNNGIAPYHGRRFCTSVPEIPGDRRPNKATLKVVHLNARFALYENMKKSLCDTNENAPYCKSWINNDDHLRLAGRLLATYDADIYNVCEVLDCKSLDIMRSAMPNADQYSVYYPEQNDHVTLQGCGLITRVDPIAPILSMDSSLSVSGPLTSTVCPSIDSFTKSLSKGVHTIFNINDIPFAFFGLHLLAQPTTDDRCSPREAQAALVTHEVTGGEFAQVTSQTYNLLSNEQRKNMEVIVVGDMNDYDFRVVNGKKETLNAYETSPSEITLHPISEVLKILREGSGKKATFKYGTGKNKDSKSLVIGDLKKQFEGIGLQNVLWLEQNPWNRRTFSDVVNSKTVKFSVLDHMLLSPNLYKSTVYAQAGATFKNFMLKKEVDDMKNQNQNGWDGKDHCTDHYPVWAHFDIDYLKKSKESTNIHHTQLPQSPIESIPDFSQKSATVIPTCRQYVEMREQQINSRFTDTFMVNRF